MQEHLLWAVRLAELSERRQHAARGARIAVHRIFRNGAVVDVGDVRKTRHRGSGGYGQNVGCRSWWHRHAINGGRNVGGGQGNGGGQTRAGTDRCYGSVARSPSRGGGEVFRAATGTERAGERVLLRCGRRAAAERNGGAARRNRQIRLAGC